MQAFLTIANKAVAFADAEPTNQPLLKYFDWQLGLKNLTVSDPKSYGGVCAAASSVTVFDGTRATTLDGTTAFSVALSSLDAGTRYRFTWTGGTNPGFRGDRGMTLSGQTVQISVNTDQSVNMVLGNSGLGPFPFIFGGIGSTLVAGDIVYIPGEITGDAAGPFNPNNTGFWTVMNVLSNVEIQAQRLPGESFSASGETVTLSSDSQFQIFVAGGVQSGDSVSISSGFAAGTRRTYTVDRVTSKWFEVLTSPAIAAQTGILPTAVGMVFYTDAKTFIHVEADQEAVLQLDGDTGEKLRLVPVQSGDRRQPGWLELRGAAHKLVLVNKSVVALNFICHTCR